MSKNKVIVLATTVFVILGFVSAAIFYKTHQEEQDSKAAKEKETLFIRNHSPQMGPDDAPVKLVEFMDPECESCRMFFPFVKNLMKKYEGKIQLTIRYVPFHGNSKFAIAILESARKQGKYWETLEILFKNQPAWGNHHQPRPELIWNYLPMVGLDVDQIKKDYKDPAWTKIIEQDFADARELGVRATPTFFINGMPLRSFGYQQLEDQIKENL
ncbi:DsbA family protein [Halobacteriovorax marinus]|nr:thioredoxin domain-containing protein [Halobacteriovorax marinus]